MNYKLWDIIERHTKTSIRANSTYTLYKITKKSRHIPITLKIVEIRLHVGLKIHRIFTGETFSCLLAKLD
jgi:hypothetical protein